MNTFQRELAEMDKIGGIRICPVEAQDGTLYMDAQIVLAKRETQADRKFIESMDKIVAANFLMPKKKKRFSWAGVLAVLAVAGVVMLLTYWAVANW